MAFDRRLPPGSLRRFEAPQPVRYTMDDLERESGVTSRTIRYYISEGLLPPAYGRGPTAVYDADHCCDCAISSNSRLHDFRWVTFESG